MGRRKQTQPRRAQATVGNNGVSKEDFCNPDTSPALKTEHSGNNNPFYIEVDRDNWVSKEHYDISEVILTNLNVSEECYDRKYEDQNFINEEKYNFRFRLNGVIKPLHIPVLSTSDIYLEFIEKRVDMEAHVMVTGNFDGPSEGVSGLVHLVSMKFLTLRPTTGLTFSGNLSSIRLRVEIQKCTFEGSESFFGTTRQIWKKSMMNVMAWLRPEVTTSEARYGYKVPEDMEIGLQLNENTKGSRFDVSGFYEAIKPSK